MLLKDYYIPWKYSENRKTTLISHIGWKRRSATTFNNDPFIEYHPSISFIKRLRMVSKLEIKILLSIILSQFQTRISTFSFAFSICMFFLWYLERMIISDIFLIDKLLNSRLFLGSCGKIFFIWIVSLTDFNFVCVFVMYLCNRPLGRRGKE